MRGFIGQLEEGNLLPHTHNTYIYTHYDFYFEYNKDQVRSHFYIYVISKLKQMKCLIVLMIIFEIFLQKIIFANVSTKERAPSKLDGLMPPVDLTFTYSVTWEQTNIAYNLRGKLLRSTGFFPKSLEVSE